jgi:twitching motility protein PilI
MTDTLSPSRELILLLQEIEQRSRRRAENQPTQAEQQNLWEGILFTAAGVPAVAPLDEVTEILNYPAAVTRVPGAKHWLLGIANIRGNLLPVIDLQVFLGSKPIIRGKRSRILVIDIDGVRAGLLVGGVQGLRHFTEGQRTAVPGVAGEIETYVRGAFTLEGEVRLVLSMKGLAESSDFQVAAA